jgi:hypothetical protein
LKTGWGGAKTTSAARLRPGQPTRRAPGVE